MKRINIILVLAFVFLNSCKSKDQIYTSFNLSLLTGLWNLVESKLKSESDWKKISPSWPRSVTFNVKGFLSSENTPFDGGWCNVAEKYTVKKDVITFEFGKPNCIPFVNPRTPSDARIVEISDQILIIEWGNVLMRFERI